MSEQCYELNTHMNVPLILALLLAGGYFKLNRVIIDNSKGNWWCTQYS